MQRVFVISDTHFGHKAIINFEAERRPFDRIETHDKELVLRWNAAVKKDDSVWHLGDVFFGVDNHEIMWHLNGIKKLVLGNHDKYPMEIYQRYFSKICGVAEYNGCVLTHIPVHPNQFHRYKLNIHGHLHSRKVGDPRYVCVSVEHTNLAPILMSEAISRGTPGEPRRN